MLMYPVPAVGSAAAFTALYRSSPRRRANAAVMVVALVLAAMLNWGQW